MSELNLLIKRKDWEVIAKNFSPKSLSEQLSFGDALILSRKMLENEKWDGHLQSFAINLINAIKRRHSEEWETDWRYDAYLGYAYDLRGWDYEEQFEAYRRAAEKTDFTHPELLMRLALNWSAPGIFQNKIDKKDAIQLLEKALGEIPYVEGVSCLIELYTEIGLHEKKEYWEKVLEESEKKKLYAPYAFLDVFKKLGWGESNRL